MIYLPHRRKAFRSGFTYSATRFTAASSQYLSRGSALNGLADGDKGLLSVWINMAGSATGSYYFLSIPTANQVRIQRTNTGKLRLVMRNSSSTSVLVSDTATSVIETSGWVHWLVSWDLSTSGRFGQYINGVSDGSASTFTVGGSIDYTSTNCFIGCTTDGASFMLDGSLCELYFATEYLDLSNASNRAKFSSGGKPISLGPDGSLPTGTQPVIYLHNSYSSFGTNSGSGGNFTINNGPLSNVTPP